jgi:hypothetical protein
MVWGWIIVCKVMVSVAIGGGFSFSSVRFST